MRVAIGLALLLVAATPGWAQQAVRDDAKAFATEAAHAAADIAGNEATATTNLPGYNGGSAPERSYLNDPAALEAARARAARSNQGAVLVIDGNASRPRVSAVLVDETVARGNIITQTPETYALGLGANGTTGQCVELPVGVSSAGTFEATCNSGSKVAPQVQSCSIPLDAAVEIQAATVYDYWVAPAAQYGAPFVRNDQFSDALASGVCKIMPETLGACAASTAVGLSPNKFCKSYSVTHYQCSAPLAGETPDIFIMPVTGHWYYATSSATVETVVTSRNEAQCSPLAPDPNCSAVGGEVCTDSDPVTRLIGTTSVTQPCWAWQRDYQCNTIVQANDCSALDANAACHFDRTVCLDDPQAGACQVEERIYTCPIPGSTTQPSQYLCGGDLYCIGTECEAVTREASTEFKDAVVGLHTLDQAAKEFDEIDYRLFKGAAQSCHKPVFGVANCCGGNGIPLIGACSSADQLLAAQIDKGFTHYVGTYCSSSFLGICDTKRQVYCAFSSKLTRILQEQGRPQIGKTWGTPKKPLCDGFTVDEFARLDLSLMDFAEIYSDFIDAARLPDEAAAMTDIQQKIRDYYARGGS
jgi:conjugal transfer mating pair stabilization protein TraN